MTESHRPEETPARSSIGSAPDVPAVTEPAAGAAPTAPRGSGRPAVRRTRFSVAWVGVTLAAVVLILLLIFILQNNRPAEIVFFGARGTLPLGVALLFAAVLGVLLVAIPGYGRILQLRRAAKGRRR